MTHTRRVTRGHPDSLGSQLHDLCMNFAHLRHRDFEATEACLMRMYWHCHASDRNVLDSVVEAYDWICREQMDGTSRVTQSDMTRLPNRFIKIIGSPYRHLYSLVSYAS